MRKTFKKRRNILIIVTMTLVVLLGVVLCKTYPMIYGKLYSGNGISTDIIAAAIKAYINAVNKIVYEEA